MNTDCPPPSTPYRREAPSLHDELVAHDELTNRGTGESCSLESLLDVSESSSTVEGSGDEFSRILQQAVSVCVCVCVCVCVYIMHDHTQHF